MQCGPAGSVFCTRLTQQGVPTGRLEGACVRSPFLWWLCDSPLHTDATSWHPLAVTPTCGWWQAVWGVLWIQVSRHPSESLPQVSGQIPRCGRQGPYVAASDGRHLSPQAPAGGRPPLEDLVAASHPQPLPRALRPREPPCAHTRLLTSWPGCREAGEPSLGWSTRPLVGGVRTHELGRGLGREGGTLGSSLFILLLVLPQLSPGRAFQSVSQDAA